MKNLSDHIHDLVENSISAGAMLIKVSMEICTDSFLRCSIVDNGKGINKDELDMVTHPFYTKRKTRSQGLGLAFIDQNSTATGGEFSIDSEPGIGTELRFSWNLRHIDCLPCGDLSEIFISLMRACQDVGFEFLLRLNTEKVIWSSKEISESIYPLSLYNSEIRDGVRGYLETTSKAFYREWDEIILSNINSEIKL